ncbi:hypothetical protein NC653_040446 [Populus alba x Populus x berolinensis]|uniref:non-specific serine/threonine protein kinase n=1 Tax=Populus alba x Populus x berolinensis TaxID=444605 RepID=A0AAD6PMT4_9ROSI|nr:hypothetical protein NC653_040446 [Populus alba x Populus x berolinensis]
MEVWTLPNLLDLVMWANNLTATGLPEKFLLALGNLVDLAVLQMGNNSLSGKIPPELGKCRSLIWLDLNSNNLTGPLPPELAGQAGLVVPGIVSGKQFAFGIRPERLENLPMAHSCSTTRIYSGMTVYTFTTNGSMIFLDLAYNSLSGDIPQNFGSLSYLQVLNLGHNKLTGNIPDSFGGLKAIGVLDLSHNDLQGFLPGSLGDPISFLSDLVCVIEQQPPLALETQPQSLNTRRKKQSVEVCKEVPAEGRNRGRSTSECLPNSGSSSWRKLSGLFVPEPLEHHHCHIRETSTEAWTSFAHLLEATNRFQLADSLIGSGGFGEVWTGSLWQNGNYREDQSTETWFPLWVRKEDDSRLDWGSQEKKIAIRVLQVMCPLRFIRALDCTSKGDVHSYWWSLLLELLSGQEANRFR